MRAMLLETLDPAGTNAAPLRMVNRPIPTPGAGEILIRVRVCGVCHTELDEIAGRTASVPVGIVVTPFRTRSVPFDDTFDAVAKLPELL